MSMAYLDVRNISKSFDDTPVLRDVSLSIPDGELLVLLGPSGCGKSTLLRLIAGLETLDDGEIHLAGRRVDELRPKDRNISLVFQNYSLYPHMSVAENLAFPLKIIGVKKKERSQQVREVARLIGLEERLDARPAELSGGQRQRVALGRAIIREPVIFLLDEPLSNLDADLRVRMRREIVGLQKKLGTAMVYVTHDQAEALTMADRIALLHEGVLQQLATPDDIYRRPVNRFVAEFVGFPRINTLPVKGPDKAPLFADLRLPAEHVADDAVLGIRPEALTLGEGPYRAPVTTSEYLGNQINITLSYRDQTLTAITGKPVTEGDQVVFDIDPSGAMLFDSAGRTVWFGSA